MFWGTSEWYQPFPLPTGVFRFLQPDEIEALAPAGELSDDATDGYIDGYIGGSPLSTTSTRCSRRLLTRPRVVGDR